MFGGFWIKHMIFVFDLDGTVCDTSKRMHYLDNVLVDWGKFYGEIQYDLPHKPVVEWIRSIEKNHTVILQTTRPQRYRKVTVRWLKDHNLLNNYDDLLMKDDNSVQSEIELKLNFLTNIKSQYPNQSIIWCDSNNEIVKLINGTGVVALHFSGKNSNE